MKPQKIRHRYSASTKLKEPCVFLVAAFKRKRADTTDLKKEWIELLSLKVKPIMAVGPSAGLVALVDVQPAWASITVISAVEMIFCLIL